MLLPALPGLLRSLPGAVQDLRVDVLVQTNDQHMSRRYWESGVTHEMGSRLARGLALVMR